MATRHYDPEQVSLVAQGVPVSGFAQGTFITVTYNEDDWAVEEGTHGEIIRSRKPNSIIEVSCSLVQGCSSNEELSNARKQDRLTGNNAGPLQIKDLNGSTLVSAAQSFAKKPADVKFAIESEAVEHTFIGTQADSHIGQNRTL